jgi:acyl-coenzyme A synthetase/AMP-(fatty) acid ligase
VRSTYEIFRNAGAAFGDKTALTFLRTGNPADAPIRWSYAELLAGIHQTANLLHTLGVGPDDAWRCCCPAAWTTTSRYGAARRPASCSRSTRC